MRAVADYCEYVSDACDAAGTGLLITGVGAGAGAALYKSGTIAGSVGDAINIGVDIYEGKYKNTFTRVSNSVASYFFGYKIGSGNGGDFMKKALDKLTDTFTNFLLEKYKMKQNIIYGLVSIIIGIIGLCGILMDKKRGKGNGSLQGLYRYMTIIWSVASLLVGFSFLIFISCESN